MQAYLWHGTDRQSAENIIGDLVQSAVVSCIQPTTHCLLQVREYSHFLEDLFYRNQIHWLSLFSFPSILPNRKQTETAKTVAFGMAKKSGHHFDMKRAGSLERSSHIGLTPHLAMTKHPGHIGGCINVDEVLVPNIPARECA